VSPGRPEPRAPRGGSADEDLDAELPRLGARTSARQRALEILYQADLLEQPITTALARELSDPRRQRPDRYTTELVSGVERQLQEIDERIEAAAERWSIDRMPLVDRNLLRLATFELLSSSEVPTAVILDEAIELAKLLSTEDSSRFINGVLGRIAREVRTR
jgi:transcription antitermination protein NusB